MNAIWFINNLITYICLLPICIYLFSFRLLYSKNKLIFIYLSACLLVELIMDVNRSYNIINQIYLIDLFVYFEMILFGFFSFKYLSKTMLFLLILIIILMFSMLLISIYKHNNPLNSMLSIQLGSGRLVLLLISINVLRSSFEMKIEKWKKTIIHALLIYSFLGITIYAFAEFFARYNPMQETILSSIIIITAAFCVILVGVLLLVNKYHRSIEAKNKEMFSSIIFAEEKERERLSRDVHDELGGLITSARLTLGSLVIDKLNREDTLKLIRIEEVLEMASISARNASLELSPIALSKFGLEGALNTFPNLYTSHDAKIDIMCKVENLNSSVEIGIFRIISEIINNSIKYSQAKDIYINVFIDTREDLNIEVGDNGIGFELDSISEKSNGLKNISNRCKVLNGQLSITTSKGNGCHYRIKFNKENYGKR